MLCLWYTTKFKGINQKTDIFRKRWTKWNSHKIINQQNSPQCSFVESHAFICGPLFSVTIHSIIKLLTPFCLAVTGFDSNCIEFNMVFIPNHIKPHLKTMLTNPATLLLEHFVIQGARSGNTNCTFVFIFRNQILCLQQITCQTDELTYEFKHP